jgi:hypothetical protein
VCPRQRVPKTGPDTPKQAPDQPKQRQQQGNNNPHNNTTTTTPTTPHRTDRDHHPKEEAPVSTDFQITPVTEPAPQPTPAPTTSPQPAAPTKTTTGTAVKELDHTPGGLPVIPLAVITGNTTVAGLSAVAVTAGPAAAAAAAGTFLVSAVAVKAAGRRTTRKDNRTSRSTAGGHRPNTGSTRTSGGTSGSGSRSGELSGQRGSGSRTAPRRTTHSASTGLGTTTRRPGSGSGARKNAGGTAPKTPSNTNPKTPGTRAQQIKALRTDKKATAPTRRERRTRDLADRRQLRDARRHDKRAQRAAKKNPTPARPANLNRPATKTNRDGKTTSPAHSKKQTVTAPLDPKTPPKTADTLRPTAADKARTKLRAARDQATQTRTARIQQARQKAKARARLAKTTAAARTRYGIQAAARGLLAAPAGLIGTLTTPLGKKLGWTWLQYPGRRLYRRLTAKARYNRDARLADAANTYAHTTDPKSLEIPDTQQPIGDTVARAPRTSHTPDLTGEPDMSEDIKLLFLDSSEETVSAARAYEPGGMLHVRQVIKAMPVALENWAMAFAVLAEKSDAEFPLGDEIGEGLDDIHQQMRQLISHAEDLATTFDRIHEHDIERLTNPRKSAEAEKTWDTTANEDYDAD